MTYYSLVKKGYGTLKEVKELDTDEFLSIVEYENMMSDIESLIYEENE